MGAESAGPGDCPLHSPQAASVHSPHSGRLLRTCVQSHILGSAAQGSPHSPPPWSPFTVLAPSFPRGPDQGGIPDPRHPDPHPLTLFYISISHVSKLSVYMLVVGLSSRGGEG